MIRVYDNKSNYFFRKVPEINLVERFLNKSEQGFCPLFSA
ncbi:hypothetical protein HMPREF9996_00264 [Aggregatibacter actinomycetemcomitans Y4]|nr:hypothetical protein HMPREF9996_00264 [Aggregatibacter actinomycetemcomitans Y4]